MLVPRRESEAATRAVRELETYLQSPERQTVLVLVATSIDRRSRIYKLLTKQATLVDCGVLDDQADAEQWIQAKVARARVSIEPAAVRMLAARAGTDVKRLRGDLDRLLLYALGQPTITVDDVKQIVRAGDAAGRLGDDQRDRTGPDRRGASSAGADARCGRTAGKNPRSARRGWCARSFPRSRPDISPRLSSRSFVPISTSSDRLALRGSCSSVWWSNCAAGAARHPAPSRMRRSSACQPPVSRRRRCASSAGICSVPAALR